MRQRQYLNFLGINSSGVLSNDGGICFKDGILILNI
jgi:hypothetical protein